MSCGLTVPGPHQNGLLPRSLRVAVGCRTFRKATHVVGWKVPRRVVSGRRCTDKEPGQRGRAAAAGVLGDRPLTPSGLRIRRYCAPGENVYTVAMQQWNFITDKKKVPVLVRGMVFNNIKAIRARYRVSC